MSTFTVYEHGGAVVLETGDWVKAEERALAKNWPSARRPLCIRGTHPSHGWDDQRPPRCRACGAWNNGSYGSHAPCGYDFGEAPLITVIERELAARKQAPR